MYYVIGLPGSGKSTAVGNVLGPYPFTAHAKPLKHCDYGFCTMFGHWRDVHPGTCTLPYSVHPVAMQFVADTIATVEAPIMVAEGDRLSGSKFFDHVLSLGMKLKIIHFVIDPIISRARAVERGNIYNDSWYKGRVTKIRNTIEKYPTLTVSIDASQEAPQIALALKNFFDFLPSNDVASMPLQPPALDLLGLYDAYDPVEIFNAATIELVIPMPSFASLPSPSTFAVDIPVPDDGTSLTTYYYSSFGICPIQMN